MSCRQTGVKACATATRAKKCCRRGCYRHADALWKKHSRRQRSCGLVLRRREFSKCDRLWAETSLVLVVGGVLARVSRWRSASIVYILCVGVERRGMLARVSRWRSARIVHRLCVGVERRGSYGRGGRMTTMILSTASPCASGRSCGWVLQGWRRRGSKHRRSCELVWRQRGDEEFQASKILRVGLATKRE